MTVHNLIKQLKKVENQFVGVEVCDVNDEFSRKEIDLIKFSTDAKLLIFIKDKK